VRGVKITTSKNKVRKLQPGEAAAFLAFAFSLSIADAATIGHWRFEEGSDGNPASGTDSVLDFSVSANHGTPLPPRS